MLYLQTHIFKVSNKDTRTTLTSDVFIDNLKHISHLFLFFLLLTLGMYLFAGMLNGFQHLVVYVYV